jgi:hypothetical protein
MIALHTYLLDDDGKIFARLTTFAGDEDEAVDLMEELDFTEANESFEILDTVVPLDAAALRSVSDAQDREPPEEDDEEEEGEEDEEER